MRPVHVYTDRGPITLIFTALKFGVALLGLILAFRALSNGETGQPLWIALLMIAGGLGFGGHDLYRTMDRKPQLTLTEEGFLDRRAKNPRIVPWSRIKSLGYRGGNSNWSLELYFADGGPLALVEGTYLQTGPRELARLIQKFAPHVLVDERFRLWIG